MARARCAAVRVLSVRDDHERARAARAQPEADGCRDRRGRDERMPLQQLPSRAQGDPPRCGAHAGAEGAGMKRDEQSANDERAGLDRREFLAAAAAGGAAFVLGFWVPPKAAAANIPGAVWYEDPAVP